MDVSQEKEEKNKGKKEIAQAVEAEKHHDLSPEQNFPHLSLITVECKQKTEQNR